MDATGHYRFGSFTLDLTRGFLQNDGVDVPLRPKAFEVLRHLVVHHGRLVAKDDLVVAVWGDTAVTDNSLAQCLFEIRRALGDQSQEIIRTVARRGYVFDAPVSVAEPQEGKAPEPAVEVALAETQNRRWPLLAVIAGVAVLALLAFAFSRARLSAPPVNEAPVQLTNFNDSAVSPSLSHDGRLLAFVRGGFFGTVASPLGQIYVKALPAGEPVQLTSDGRSKYQPVFSPDDARIVYTTAQGGLSWDSWQVPVLRGTPQPFLKNASGVTWLDGNRLLYSTIMSGVHMGIASSTASQLDYKEIYFPNRPDGMAHRSAASPDGKALLVVEMVGGTWTPCRLIPADGASAGQQVGPADGQCTSAAWSPDGRWMYFSSNAGGAYHLWRQRFPDGVPEQITFGPTEQEGTAVTADGKHVITSMGLQQASLWLVGADRERQLSTERFATQPSLDPSGTTLYYVARTQGSRGQTSGELRSVNLGTGNRQTVLPGTVITTYSIARNGDQLLFTSQGAAGGDGVWISSLPRREPPRRVAAGNDIRAFFSGGDEFVYTAGDGLLYRMKTDGTGRAAVSDEPVSYLEAVSPDGRWAVVVRPSARTGSFTRLELMSLKGGPSFTVCEEDCNVGPRSFLGASPFVWSHDGSRLIVNLAPLGKGTTRSVSLPYSPGVRPESLWPRGLRSERTIMDAPGASVAAAPFSIPGPEPGSVIAWRWSTLSNLYRMRIPEPR